MWAIVLVPPMVRSRANRRPHTSIDSFNSQLGRLGQSGTGQRPRAASTVGRYPVSGQSITGTSQPYGTSQHYGPTRMSKSQAAKRRRGVLMCLMVVAAVSLLAGLLPGLGFMLVIFAVSAMALAGFIAISSRQVRIASDRARQVQFASRTMAQRPAMVRPRQASQRYEYQ